VSLPVRLRFAPSPTGPLHIGGARTALFNWLYARHCGGVFVLRIEDTDRSRLVPEALDDIVSGLRWLGIDWDEGPDVGGPYGPYCQSERADLYRHWARWLIEQGQAYKCWCTSERLDMLRHVQHQEKGKVGYDRHCRRLDPTQVAQLESSGAPYVVRFKVPASGGTSIQDLIRGDITFQHEQLEDLVLLKSDGFPTYHLANVVDDHFMEITHIVRADEWIPTAPLHVLMYDAFGWKRPVYAHAPLILNPSGKGKLSKRTQAFTDEGQEVLVQLREFRRAGYLPEAVVNFLANVGWAFGDDQEVFTMEQATPRFELSDVNPAPARLPYSKLDWLNGVYIRELEPSRLATAAKPFLEAAGLPVDDGLLLKAIPLVRERIKTLREAVSWLDFLFIDQLAYDPSLLVENRVGPAGSLLALTRVREVLAALTDFETERLEAALRTLVADLGVKPAQLFGIVRVAVSGKTVAPPLFGTLGALGKDRVLARLDQAINLLSRLVM